MRPDFASALDALLTKFKGHGFSAEELADEMQVQLDGLTAEAIDDAEEEADDETAADFDDGPTAA